MYEHLRPPAVRLLALVLFLVTLVHAEVCENKNCNTDSDCKFGYSNELGNISTCFSTCVDGRCTKDLLELDDFLLESGAANSTVSAARESFSFLVTCGITCVLALFWGILG